MSTHTNLSPSDLARVEDDLASLSLQEKLGMLIMPEDRGYDSDDWTRLLAEVPLGCAFLQAPDVSRIEENIRAIQRVSRRPVLIASDMEDGYLGGTRFPSQMAVGATRSAQLARRRGFVMGREARAAGIHWLFSPVVDLARNPNNPETVNRAFSADAGLVATLAAEQIRGMQADGQVAATAKHFPGAGSDDRDQHLCTALNPLELGEWWSTYGSVWRAVIESGVLAVMTGHIALPAYDGVDAPAARPATLSGPLQRALLREELGFDGVIVSDAAPMIGISSRVSSRDLAVEFILAGGDVLLFADPVRDFRALCAAVDAGRLGVDVVNDRARRVLRLRAALGVDATPFGVVDKESGGEATAGAIARHSITVVRDDGTLPVTPARGARVTTVTVTNPHHEPLPELACVDDELRARGYLVDHLVSPSHRELIRRAERGDHIFLNLLVGMHTWKGSARLLEEAAMVFWRGWWIDHPGRVTVTSFGSPFHLVEIPSLPNMICAYSGSAASQRAAVRFWLGEADAPGWLPIRLPEYAQ